MTIEQFEGYEKRKGANREIVSASMPTKMFVTLHSDQILDIRNYGASVEDLA